MKAIYHSVQVDLDGMVILVGGGGNLNSILCN